MHLVPSEVSSRLSTAFSRLTRILGGLTGLYQLFIASGTMLSFWVNYVREPVICLTRATAIPNRVNGYSAINYYLILC